MIRSDGIIKNIFTEARDQNRSYLTILLDGTFRSYGSMDQQIESRLLLIFGLNLSIEKRLNKKKANKMNPLKSKSIG